MHKIEDSIEFIDNSMNGFIKENIELIKMSRRLSIDISQLIEKKDGLYKIKNSPQLFNEYNAEQIRILREDCPDGDNCECHKNYESDITLKITQRNNSIESCLRALTRTGTKIEENIKIILKFQTVNKFLNELKNKGE